MGGGGMDGGRGLKVFLRLVSPHSAFSVPRAHLAAGLSLAATSDGKQRRSPRLRGAAAGARVRRIAAAAHRRGAGRGRAGVVPSGRAAPRGGVAVFWGIGDFCSARRLETAEQSAQAMRHGRPRARYSVCLPAGPCRRAAVAPAEPRGAPALAFCRMLR
eukprot:354575-Chlamydomonas_euryale.AAC.4